MSGPPSLTEWLSAPLPGRPAPEIRMMGAHEIGAEWGAPRELADVFELLARANPIAWSNKNRDEARQQLETLKRAWVALLKFQRYVIRGGVQVRFPIGTKITTVPSGPEPLCPRVYAVNSELTGDDVATMLRFDRRLIDLPGYIRSALAANHRDEAVSWLQRALASLQGTIDTLAERVHG